MRRLLVLLVAVGTVVFLGAYVALVAVMASMRAGAAPATCLATVGPVGDPHGSDGQQQAAQLDTEQRGIAAAIIHTGQRRHLPSRAWQVAIQAGQTESGLRNLAYGDRDSLGIFQMRPSMGWGTAAQLQDVNYQINTFYDRLLQVPGWESMRPGTAAQQVERSGFPQRYHQWESLAVVLVSEVGGVADATGCGSTGAPGAASPGAGKAIQAALSKQGAPYVWGAKGPDTFDCSGLVYWAYQQAGITIPAGSWMQYDAGQKVPLSQAQPGDLVFWATDTGDPDSIHHVAIYLGTDQVVQAPYTGQPVQVSPLHHSALTRDAELMPMAVRPGR